MKKTDKQQKMISYLGRVKAPVEVEQAAKDTGDRQAEQTLAALLRAGRVVRTRKGRYALPEKVGQIRGTVFTTRKGTAYLVQEDKKDDLFIRQEDRNGAMHGDTVVARVMPMRGRFRMRNAAVLEITERAHTTLTGVVRREARTALLIPEDPRFDAVVIPAKHLNDAQSGQIAVGRILTYPTDYAPATVEIIEILGDSSSAQAQLLAIIRQFGLKDEFEPQTLSCAEKVPLSVSEKDLRGRADYRSLYTVTIDGADAKDFDDAVSLEKTEHGWTLYVHIADVSHYVAPQDPLDREAQMRGTSVYFPGLVLPMLPEALSNGICSLNAGVDRLAVTCVMETAEDSTVLSYRFERSVIRVDQRVTYEKANAFLEQGEVPEAYAGQTMALLKNMAALAKRCTERRLARGALDFDLPEPAFVLDETGRALDVFVHPRGVSNRMIEEFMLMANECAAAFTKERHLPCLYRVHEDPDNSRLEALSELLKALGEKVPPELGSPKTLQAVLRAAEGKPYAAAINHVTLRAMKKARYSHEPIGHYALAAKDYCHFTSPIRRYPDITVHRAITAAIEGREKDTERFAVSMPGWGDQCSECERIAMEAERAVDDLKCCEYMQDRLGEIFTGTVAGVTEFGLFVALENTVEGLVRLSGLDDDEYEFDERLFCVEGHMTGRRIALGDTVKVQVAAVDLGQRRIEFELVRNLPPHRRRRRR
ncbi:MAG: ribonuclease R [Clostridia bacterium]|nr:ribonuclease R [Clostridia bacterium]